MLTGLALLPVLALTLRPGGRSGLAAGCAFPWSLPMVGRVELMADVLLFVVPLLLGSVARRPRLAWAAGVAGSCVDRGGAGGRV